MRTSFGETRSAFGRRYAVISQDSHERVTLPHWPACGLVHLVTPALGADFALFLVTADRTTTIPGPAEDVERFVLRQNGTVRIGVDDAPTQVLGDEGYAFLPAGCASRLDLTAGAAMIVLERRYRGMADIAAPAPFFGAIPAVTATPMKGDARLMLQKLLPEGTAFDMEINVMDFAPGASLPYVETHFMEHGLVLLNGGGIYRLEETWFPVDTGDAIWMGPFCPQWFGAIGHGHARYLIYKNWNRDPLHG